MKKFKGPIILLVALLIAYVGYNYIYQDHRDIEKETSQFTITSKALIKEFQKDAPLAETKYLNKTIEVSGSISEINLKDLTLDGYIFNNFNINLNRNELQINKTIIIKGRCIGYDDLLEQVKLDQCSIKN